MFMDIGCTQVLYTCDDGAPYAASIAHVRTPLWSGIGPTLNLTTCAYMNGTGHYYDEDCALHLPTLCVREPFGNFARALDHSNWIECARKTDPCLMCGIVCNSDGKITEMDLRRYGLKGKLPDMKSDDTFSSLKQIDLSENPDLVGGCEQVPSKVKCVDDATLAMGEGVASAFFRILIILACMVAIWFTGRRLGRNCTRWKEGTRGGHM